MPKAKVIKGSNKKQEKLMKQPKKEIKKERRLVALRNKEKMLASGWKEVKEKADPKGKVEGVRTHSGDLVLMEK